MQMDAMEESGCVWSVSSLHHGSFKGFQAGRLYALMPQAESAEGEKALTQIWLLSIQSQPEPPNTTKIEPVILPFPSVASTIRFLFASWLSSLPTVV